MDWVSILAAGIVGGIAAAIASLTVGTSKRFRFAAAMFILFLTLQLLSDRMVLPRVRLWQVDRKLREAAFFRDIAEADPQMYTRVLAVALDSSQKGEAADSIMRRVGRIILPTLPKYAGAASDDSIIAFVDAMVREVDGLHRAQSDNCYYSLFPDESGAPPLSSLYPDEGTMGKSVDAVMAGLVHSAVHNPQPLPDTARAKELRAVIYDRLLSKYGNDVFLLQQTPADSAGRQKVCEMAVSLYKDAESLPKADASLVLRYLLSTQ